MSYLDLAGLRALREKGSLAEGMMPKAASIEAALTGGVRRVHIMSVRVGEGVDPLLVLEVHRERHLDKGRRDRSASKVSLAMNMLYSWKFVWPMIRPLKGMGGCPSGLKKRSWVAKSQLVEKPVRELENLVDLHETIGARTELALVVVNERVGLAPESRQEAVVDVADERSGLLALLVARCVGADAGLGPGVVESSASL